ncbi:MAG: hypothetical protein AB7G15_10225 [Alphaproteobacteria bacterium]
MRFARTALLVLALFPALPAAAKEPACMASPTRACILADALALARETSDVLERGMNFLAIAQTAKRADLIAAAQSLRPALVGPWRHAQLGREIARVQAALGHTAEALVTADTIRDPRVRVEALTDIAAATRDATLLARAREIAATIRARDWESFHQRRNAFTAIATTAATISHADTALEVCRQVFDESGYFSCFEDILRIFADAGNFPDAWRALQPMDAEYARNAGLAIVAHALIEAKRADEAREIAGRITYLTTRSYVLAHIAAEAKDLARLREISLAVYQAYHKPNTDNPHHGAYMIRFGRIIARAGFDDEAMKYASNDSVRPYILLGLIDNRIERGAWSEAAAFLAQIPSDGWADVKLDLGRKILVALTRAGRPADAARAGRAMLPDHRVPALMLIYGAIADP